MTRPRKQGRYIQMACSPLRKKSFYKAAKDKSVPPAVAGGAFDRVAEAPPATAGGTDPYLQSVIALVGCLKIKRRLQHREHRGLLKIAKPSTQSSQREDTKTTKCRSQMISSVLRVFPLCPLCPLCLNLLFLEVPLSKKLFRGNDDELFHVFFDDLKIVNINGHNKAGALW